MTTSKILVLFTSCAIANGCLVISGGVDFIRTEEQRNRVKFENVQAWRTFYDSVGKVEAKEEESSGFFIPFILLRTHQNDYSFNAVFNDQAAIADIDGNGEITEMEAKEHAKYVKKKSDKK